MLRPRHALHGEAGVAARSLCVGIRSEGSEGAVLRPGFTSHMKGLCRFVSRRVACSSMLTCLVRVLNPDEM